MVMSTDDLSDWKDFPKGLRVLVLDEDFQAAAETKSKLEGFEYVVFTFSNEKEALAALQSQTNSFHVALVEVTTGNSCGAFRFLETACDLPTIMMSNMSCLSTMMKCIALGAAEFLQKPISEDKLKNIWQHVVHKAFSARETVLSEYLKPVKATVASMLQLGSEQAQVKNKNLHGEDSPSGSQAEVSALHEMQDCRYVPVDPVKQEPSLEPCNSEKFPAPSTPQLEQGGRSTSNEDAQDKVLRLDNSRNLKTETWDADNNLGSRGRGEMKLDIEATSDCAYQVDSWVSAKKETQDLDGISLRKRNTSQSGLKSVDNTCEQLGNGITSCVAGVQSRLENVLVHAVDDSGGGEEEVGSVECSKSDGENIEKEAAVSSSYYNEENVDSSTEDKKGKKSNADHGCKRSKTAASKKKTKVEWTLELHRRFVQAVEQLGIDQAIPSRILELMKVDGLTRHNVASHLQKYRSHRRHIISREDEAASRRSWQHVDTAWTRTNQEGPWSLHGNPASRPIIAFPPVPLHPTPHGPHVGPPLHVWGHPTVDQSGRHMWQQPPVGTPTAWQAQDGSFWKHPGMSADAWGCPAAGVPFYPQTMMTLPSCHASGVNPCPNSTTAAHGSLEQVLISDPANNNAATIWGKSIDVHPPKELIDDAIKEALNNPWTPLPLGLKPPSMESVLAELQRQGISKIPPPAS